MTVQDAELIADAYALAANAHRGQIDAAGYLYFHHVLRVAAALRDRGPVYEIVGVLHDVIEDSPVTLADIRVRFGDVIADAVDAMTRREEDRYFKDYMPRVMANPIACAVKFADSTDNLNRVMIEDPPESWAKLGKKYRRVLDMLSGHRTEEEPWH